MDYYMHILPGRIQIRTSAFRKNEDWISMITKMLKPIQGITSIKINEILGSLLIDYNQQEISSRLILNQLSVLGYVPGIRLKDKSTLENAAIRKTPSQNYFAEYFKGPQSELSYSVF